MENWTQIDFVCAAYAVAGGVLTALVLLTIRDWRRARQAARALPGSGEEDRDA